MPRDREQQPPGYDNYQDEENDFVEYNQPRQSNQFNQNPPNYPSQVSFGQNRAQQFQAPQMNNQNQFRNQNPVNLKLPTQNVNQMREPPATDRNYTRPLHQQSQDPQSSQRMPQNEMQRIQDELEQLEMEKQKRDQQRQRAQNISSPRQQMVESYRSDQYGDESNRSREPGQDQAPIVGKQFYQKAAPNNFSQKNFSVNPQNSKNDKMYKDLYHKVMNSTAQKNRMDLPEDNGFNVYKAGWNQLQDKRDSQYQNSLKVQNTQQYSRMMESDRLRQLRLEAKTLKYKEQQNKKEMAECTFSPRIKETRSTSNLLSPSDRYNQGVDPRRNQEFLNKQNQFLAQKAQRLQRIKQEDTQKLKSLSKQNEFMSKGSRKILRNGIGEMNKSQSAKSFLQRNFYNTDKNSRTRLNQRKSSNASNLSKSNSYMRDMSGSRVSFINSSSSVTGSKMRDNDGKPLFKPKINSKSKLMSPRDRDTTFYMLHQAAVNQQRKHEISRFEADVKAKKVITKHQISNVNSTSDNVLVKQFYDEFCSVIQDQIEQSNQIYLVDVVDQLHFINQQQLMDQSLKMNALLSQHKKNLYIDTEAGQFRGDSEDITKNLFKVCCAIMNLRPKQRNNNPLDETILKHYLQAIKEQGQQKDTLVIDQLSILKGLVNRKAFSLTDHQINQINKKFMNFSVDRKNYNLNKRKYQTQKRVIRETTPVFSPKINSRSRDIDYDQNYNKMIPRTEIMHGYAKRYNEHKNQLRKDYEQNVKEFKYEPQLNKNSLRLVGDSTKNFNDRTMEHYIKKHQRNDRDPDQIEYERQQQDCTFKPQVPSKLGFSDRGSSFSKGGNTPIDFDQDQPATNRKNNQPIKRKPMTDQNQYKNTNQLKNMQEFLQSPPQIPIKENLPQDFNSLPQSHGGYNLPQPAQTPKQNNHPQPEEPQQLQQQPQPKIRQQPPTFPQPPSRRPLNSYLPVVEEPICVLKIELDGEHIEEIKVFENDDPNEIVQKFGSDFNLSQNARQRLLDQIQEQIQMDDDF